MRGYIGAIQSPSAESEAYSSGDQTLTKASRAVYIGGDGTLEVRLVKDDVDRTFSNVKAGTVLPIACSAIKSGTTASGVIALL